MNPLPDFQFYKTETLSLSVFVSQNSTQHLADGRYSKRLKICLLKINEFSPITVFLSLSNIIRGTAFLSNDKNENLEVEMLH